MGNQIIVLVPHHHNTRVSCSNNKVYTVTTRVAIVRTNYSEVCGHTLSLSDNVRSFALVIAAVLYSGTLKHKLLSLVIQLES